jgi:transcriptional regulator with XRE-family HTH domain
MDTLFSDQLRSAIENAKMSVYSLCRITGIDKAVMSRFMSGRRGLSLTSIDRICNVLGLRLVSGTRGAERRKTAK